MHHFPNKLFAHLAPIFLLALGITTFLPDQAFAQDGLRRMVVEQEQMQRIVVFPNHPDKAAVIISSSIPGLQIDSNLGIVADQSETGTGEYRIVLEPSRQIIYIDAPGFMRATFQTGNLNARDVIYLNVEPEDRSITDTGVLIIRTEPSGATIRIAGIPGTFTSPYTFDPILAQTHSVQVELQDYETETLQVRVDTSRPVIETIRLTPRFGFLTVNVANATLFLRDEGAADEYRRSYTPGQPLRLDVGQYTYRLTRENYADATGTFTITPNQPATIEAELTAMFGFLRVATQNPILIVVTSLDGAGERRLTQVRPNQEFQLPTGEYQYRASREFHQDETGTFTIFSNDRTLLNPNLPPAYGTLIVSANVREVQLRAADNSAPVNPRANAIYLEQGRRTVTVSAPGYVPQELDIRITPGEVIEQSVNLETLAQRDERLRREELPRGVLDVRADVDAEIWVNGQREGTGSVVLTLVPGRYDVELRHAVGRRRFSMEVPPADMVQRFEVMRPARSTALRYAAFLPGSGHVYRKEGRGYVYSGLFLGSVVYSGLMLRNHRHNLQNHDQALQAYSSAGSSGEAAAAWATVSQTYQESVDSRQALLIAGGIVAGVYAIQLLDVAITRPRYGYREGRAGATSNPSRSALMRNDIREMPAYSLSASVQGMGITLHVGF
jgi:hypothetical protein